MDHNELWKILKELGILDRFTCLLRNRYARQDGTVRTGHGMNNWFKNGRGIQQGCISSPCLFIFYVEHTSLIILSCVID